MDKAKSNSDQNPRIVTPKLNQKPTKREAKKERCHLHGVIRGGRFYLD